MAGVALWLVEAALDDGALLVEEGGELWVTGGDELTVAATAGVAVVLGEAAFVWVAVDTAMPCVTWEGVDAGKDAWWVFRRARFGLRWPRRMCLADFTVWFAAKSRFEVNVSSGLMMAVRSEPWSNRPLGGLAVLWGAACPTIAMNAATQAMKVFAWPPIPWVTFVLSTGPRGANQLRLTARLTAAWTHYPALLVASASESTSTGAHWCSTETRGARAGS